MCLSPARASPIFPLDLVSQSFCRIQIPAFALLSSPSPSADFSSLTRPKGRLCLLFTHKYLLIKSQVHQKTEDVGRTVWSREQVKDTEERWRHHPRAAADLNPGGFVSGTTKEHWRPGIPHVCKACVRFWCQFPASNFRGEKLGFWRVGKTQMGDDLFLVKREGSFRAKQSPPPGLRRTQPPHTGR